MEKRTLLCFVCGSLEREFTESESLSHQAKSPREDGSPKFWDCETKIFFRKSLRGTQLKWHVYVIIILSWEHMFEGFLIEEFLDSTARLMSIVSP